ncbi:MAG: gamma-glutamyl-gamma-aminobutyrate hydrolase family protein, partial [Bdellovibrionales bacterium]|nr:gamma-glutamyl-gamma-aminobutyrate hydrolase family protein [Bdellovibrionales bacterium]
AVLHGKTSKITNNGRGLFSGLPRQFSVARYHSLAAVNDHKSKVLEVDATSDDGEVMALSHKTFPIWGIQFHPESFMSEFGAEIIDNFLSKQ